MPQRAISKDPDARDAASGPEANLGPAAEPRILVARTAAALGLETRQALRLRRALQERRRQLRAVRERLAECRAELQAVLAQPESDAEQVFELAREERLLLEKQRSRSADLDRELAAILTREQLQGLRRR